MANSAALFEISRRALLADVDDKLRISAVELSNIINAYEKVTLSERATMPVTVTRNRISIGPPVVKSEARKIIDSLWKSQSELLDYKDDFIRVMDAQGQVVMQSGQFPDELQTQFDQYFAASGEETAFKTTMTGEAHLRIVRYPFVSSFKVPYVIEIGTSLRRIDGMLRKFVVASGISILGILLLTSFVGGIFVSRILKPVRRIIESANRISAKDLHVRIPEVGADEEICYLIESLNRMIERLETSFSHINQFSSHVAHELKTPLAIIRGEMEVAAEQAKSPEDFQTVVQNCLEEIQNINRIITDILLLARVDYRPDVLQLERINLCEFLGEIFEHSQVLAEAKEMRVELECASQNVFVQADKVHLRRLVFNLVNNAIKYSPRTSRIILRLEKEGKEAVVSVQDFGMGISEKNVLKIFDQFYRVPQESEEIEPGTGLGLSIAQAIARAHRGRLCVNSQLGAGSTFILHLPLA
ncbi:MAG: HAMP domain-containing protein [Candidatus Omnitrophica bacterium]|nr:HAMP domain-containing protein [Candidatus Omnitrophota bacterium]